MFDTLGRLLKHRGKASKAIVWVHNSHIGDPPATSMGWTRGELNLRQLCKDMYGKDAAAFRKDTASRWHRWQTVLRTESWRSLIRVFSDTDEVLCRSTTPTPA